MADNNTVWCNYCITVLPVFRQTTIRQTSEWQTSERKPSEWEMSLNDKCKNKKKSEWRMSARQTSAHERRQNNKCQSDKHQNNKVRMTNTRITIGTTTVPNFIQFLKNGWVWPPRARQSFNFWMNIFSLEKILPFTSKNNRQTENSKLKIM